ncbi:unnamed protein product [Effrenium voratum]|uniref:Uncharacterized protein n=1 Tax=Effrenium voratum TaxID=2562239 RepID=A0AA36MXT0_9DINO|nr:unnamed protein product [Effrenium voratum]
MVQLDGSLRLLASYNVLHGRQFFAKSLMAMWFFSLLEWAAFSSVICLAQWTSQFFLFLAFLAMMGAAVHRTVQTSSSSPASEIWTRLAEAWWKPLLTPVYLFLPEQHSCYGLSSQSPPATGFYTLHATLRLGSVLLWLLTMARPVDMCVAPVLHFWQPECAEVPSWIQGCGTTFSPQEYTRCLRSSWLDGACNLLAAQCRNQAEGQVDLTVSLFVDAWMSAVPLATPVLCLLFVLARWEKFWAVAPDANLRHRIQEEEQRLQEQLCNGDQLTHNWSWWLHLDLALLALDFGTDLFCLLIFLGARNWGFAFLQLLLVSSTVARCVQRGPQAVLEAFKTSKAQGFVSQSYLEIAQAERIMRAPLAFVLQYYSFAFIAGDCFQVWILSISVLFSLVSATQGGFILVDLDVAPEQLSTLLRWDC